jgi:hypothetical protein
LVTPQQLTDWRFGGDVDKLTETMKSCPGLRVCV